MKQMYCTQQEELGNPWLQDMTPLKAFTYIAFEKKQIFMKTYRDCLTETSTVSGGAQGTNGCRIGNYSGLLLNAGYSLRLALKHLLSATVGQKELERLLVSPTIPVWRLL